MYYILLLWNCHITLFALGNIHMSGQLSNVFRKWTSNCWKIFINWKLKRTLHTQKISWHNAQLPSKIVELSTAFLWCSSRRPSHFIERLNTQTWEASRTCVPSDFFRGNKTRLDVIIPFFSGVNTCKSQHKNRHQHLNHISALLVKQNKQIWKELRTWNS